MKLAMDDESTMDENDNDWIWVVYDDFKLNENFSLIIGKPIMKHPHKDGLEFFQFDAKKPIQ